MSKKQKRQKIALSVMAGLMALLMLLPMVLTALDAVV